MMVMSATSRSAIQACGRESGDTVDCIVKSAQSRHRHRRRPWHVFRWSELRMLAHRPAMTVLQIRLPIYILDSRGPWHTVATAFCRHCQTDHVWRVHNRLL